MQGFIYAPFHRITNLPIVFFEPEIIIVGNEVEPGLFKDIEQMDPLYNDTKSNTPIEIDRAGYLKQIETCKDYFNQYLLKVVLSRVSVSEKPGNFNPGKFLLKLTAAYPSAFCHLINIPGAGCWAGASPEALLRNDGKTIRTMALAGTQPFDVNVDVSWGPKEIEEQEMVSGFIESVFYQAGITRYAKSQPESVMAGNVWHLSTEFEFSSSIVEYSFNRLIQLLHPTPAVCGLPKKQALELIQQIEQHNREYYSGYCGPLNVKGSTDLFVNLRCMKIMENELAVYAGGGLTAGSDPSKEWEETEWKAKTLLSKI